MSLSVDPLYLKLHFRKNSKVMSGVARILFDAVCSNCGNEIVLYNKDCTDPIEKIYRKFMLHLFKKYSFCMIKLFN